MLCVSSCWIQEPKLRVLSVLQLVNIWTLPVNALTVFFFFNFERNPTWPLAVPHSVLAISQSQTLRNVEWISSVFPFRTGLAPPFEITLQIILYKNFTWKNFHHHNGKLLDFILKMLFAFKRAFWRRKNHFFFKSTNGAFLTHTKVNWLTCALSKSWL